MASSSHKLSIFFSFFVALISITNVNGDLIDTVCAKTQRPPFCQQTLRADPRSKTADLKGLGFISIDITTKQANSGKTLVQSLLNGAVDQKVKSALSSCLENYGDSIDTLGECSDALKSGDYGGLNIKASSALDSFGTCDDGFSDFSKPEPPQLKDASSNLQGICDIILVISNLLKA
ncbi:unnamed protein product [Cuscuta epithymum]|uniref:Pectinesterase inhibitor domain-containing protein n=1 Tax=Cuscuta epithymum TaxID=186058 RepID=A0AAV0E761_9ASTE|nr:unnamed protein product [Cuscuta epithymum]